MVFESTLQSGGSIPVEQRRGRYPATTAALAAREPAGQLAWSSGRSSAGFGLAPDSELMRQLDRQNPFPNWPTFF